MVENRDQSVIEIRDPDINVKEIIKTIQDRIEEKKRAGIYKDDPILTQKFNPLNSDFFTASIKGRLELLKILAAVNLDGEPITSHRPLSGFFIKSVKKFFRYWIRKYTDSVFAKQNQFNNEVITLLDQISDELDEIKKKFDDTNRKGDE